jgi:UDP-N-acetylmuramoylalanine--D-glutamate ligase
MKGGVIYFKGAPYIGREDIKLKGVHNVENAMAAILMSDFAGAGDNAIRETLNSFSGLEHRLEFVRKINGVEYYNDAKSTTANSLEKALLSFDSPVVLIAGGRDKGLSFRNLRSLAHKKIKKLILIGEAAEKLEKELSFPGSCRADSLDEAVKYAYAAASCGDVVILSPGCASFDMFRNYEERGKKFKELVNLLGI